MSIVEKVYNEILLRGTDYGRLYDFDEINNMAGKTLTTSQRVYIIKDVNHNFMLTFDNKMLSSVRGIGYEIAPQHIQYNRLKKRGRKAERQLEWGIKETDCMEINMLQPVQVDSRIRSLDWGKMTLAAMRRSQQILSTLTKNDVKDAVKDVMKNLKGKIKFKK
jgi:hypothetical protein